jgi:hypothetical protein
VRYKKGSEALYGSLWCSPSVLDLLDSAVAAARRDLPGNRGQSETWKMCKVRNNGPALAGEETDGSRLP